MHLPKTFMSVVLSAIFILLSIDTIAQQSYNLGFEQQQVGKPVNWALAFGNMNAGFLVKTDSAIVKQGKYSLSIEKVKEGDFGVCAYEIPPVAKSGKLKLTGYIKTENVSDGYAGLWMRLDGHTDMQGFDNMEKRGVTGTTAWQQYEITLPYDAEKVKTIVIGGLLTGKGKMWLDDLVLMIEGTSIEKAELKKEILSKGEQDTLLNKASGISSIQLSPERIKTLTNLGMLWGFLKYYHPAIANGDYNWDAELFRIMPKVMAASTPAGANSIMEAWVDGLGKVPACKNCKLPDSAHVKLWPDYGYLFATGNLPASLVSKLAYIRDHHKAPKVHYYIGSNPGVGNPEFKNELAFNNSQYPDAGIRMLALYRYWNMIQYFFPYKHLIGEDWNKVLPEFIPRFANARDKGEYAMACLELIARIHDTHANIWSNTPALQEIKGNLILPVQGTFVENKLVVTGYYLDTQYVREQLRIGDVITKIDGKAIDELIQQNLSRTPASNYETQLRDMPSLYGFLLRSNDSTARLSVMRDGVTKEVMIKRIPVVSSLYNTLKGRSDTAYKILSGNIGYIYPAKLNAKDIDKIKEVFGNTKGLVIDLRCYPSTFMPFTYGEWLKSSSTPFVKFTGPSLDHPGAIMHSSAISNGQKHDGYKGKVVIIVNETTQSQAEYTTMALCTVPGSVVIGSTTAGADGNVSSIRLPGGISTMISGIGVYYPDGTETQRVGVRIDEVVKPTIKGIAASKDELLERAVAIINQGK